MSPMLPPRSWRPWRALPPALRALFPLPRSRWLPPGLSALGVGAVLATAASGALAQQPPEPRTTAANGGSGLQVPGFQSDPWPSRYVPDERARAAGVAEGSVWSLHLSPGTWHANPSDDHRHSTGLGLRRAIDARQFVGINAFSNSFGQPSAYAMYGQRLYGGVPALPKLYLEWTAGLMYGYVGDRADEVPLNVRGFSPVFTLSPGWQISPQLSAQLNVIGTVAVMLQLDWRFR